MSDKRRFFVEEITSDEVILGGEEFSHARTVLRLETGSELILLDNSGKEYDGIVSFVGKKEMTVHIVGVKEGEREAKTDVTLLFGYLKNADKNEFVVQKATELGVKEIILFTSEYSSAYVNDNKIERLKKIAQESAKQCLRSCAPKVSYCADFTTALKMGQKSENKLFACEFLQGKGADLSKLNGSTTIVIGSEGGFSKREFEEAIELGYSGVTLGKRILRAETAAISLTSIVMYSLKEMEL